MVVHSVLISLCAAGKHFTANAADFLLACHLNGKRLRVGIRIYYSQIYRLAVGCDIAAGIKVTLRRTYFYVGLYIQHVIYISLYVGAACNDNLDLIRNTVFYSRIGNTLVCPIDCFVTGYLLLYAIACVAPSANVEPSAVVAVEIIERYDKTFFPVILHGIHLVGVVACVDCLVEHISLVVQCGIGL